MANRKTRQKISRRSNKQSTLSKIIFSRGFLIFLLIVLLAILVYWFLPQIVGWLTSTWQNIVYFLGIGLLLIAIFLVTIVSIITTGHSSFFIKFWHQIMGSTIFLLFIWALVAYLNPQAGGLLGQQLITGSSPSQLGILMALLFFSILFMTPRGIWYIFRQIAMALRLASRSIISTLSRKPIVREEKGIFIRRQKQQKRTVSEPSIFAEEAAVVGEKLTPPSQSQSQPTLTPGGWKLPPITILDLLPEPEVTESDVEKRGKLIIDALASYGVEAKIVQINVGPTVTQFGVEPGWDIKYKEIREKDKDGNIRIKQQEVSRTRVKVERISSLANDLALALAASSIRIEAPVPGKSIVGIEVPNTTFGSVNLRSIIESSAYQKLIAKSKLAIPMGKGAGGEVVAADLAKMPHLLIAGSTGSGKTVFINSVISCLLFYNTPDDLKFIMIDPKRVELVNYNAIPQLITPVVVDTNKAVISLRWLVDEMDRRYKKFAESGTRNIDIYNKDKAPGETMPYIILVIDELADLMMTAFGEVEQNLCRLAQLSRATGIHLIVATQRPSVDVITGLIKANFPTRISFSLTSQIDSRTILDTPGAEKLLGRGDMLYMPTDASKPKRLQGPFLTDQEIERLVKFWGEQKRQDEQQINFEEMEQKVFVNQEQDEPLLEESRQLATEHTGISTSFLQRKLKIGYPRAARIMEKLKEEGF